MPKGTARTHGFVYKVNVLLDSTDFLLLVKWPYISVSEWDETALVTKVHFSALTRKTSRQHRPGRMEAREEPEREINRDKEQRQFFSGGQKSSLTQTVQHMVLINPEAH